jgi:hypothetical protein
MIRGRAGADLHQLTTRPFPDRFPTRQDLTLEQKRNSVPSMFLSREVVMLKIFVEEAAALASLTLFIAMIAIWAQLIPQL